MLHRLNSPAWRYAAYAADGAAASGEPSGGEVQGFDSSALDDVIIDIGDDLYVSDSGKEKGQESFLAEGDADGEADGETSDDKGAKKADTAKTTDTKAKAEDDGKAKDEGEAETDKATGLVKHLRKTIKGLEKRIGELEVGGKKGDAKDTKEPFSRDQLLQIMKEHADDPETLLNVMEYMQQQGVKGAEEASKVAAKHQELSGKADSFLKSAFENYEEDEFQDDLDEHVPADRWGLKNHPLEKQIRGLILLSGHLQEIVQKRVDTQVKEELSKRETDLKKKTEETRQADLQKRTGPAKSTVKSKTADPSGIDRVARELRMTESQRKLYEKFRGVSR